MARISWIIRDLKAGGAETMALRAAQGLRERGHRVDLVLFFPVNDLAEEVPPHVSVFVLGRPPGRWRLLRRRAANLLRERKKQHRHAWVSERIERPGRRLSVWKLPGLLFQLAKRSRWPIRDLTRRSRRADFLRALRLGGYIEERRPDIVFTNLWQADVAGFFASLITPNCPAIVPIIHISVDENRTRNLHLIRRILSASVHVVGVSRGTADACIAHAGVPADRVTAIWNPVVTAEIARRSRAAPDHPWFQDGGPPVVLGAGRLAPQKDFRTLIEAFRRASTKHPCRLLILGEGSMRQELEDLVRALGLEHLVSLPGWVGNPYAFMARAALFVLSSRYEGFGNVLAEALSCGCPAISTDCPSGPSEILRDPDLLVPVGDPEMMAKAMLRSLGRTPDRPALRARAARFSVDRAADAYDDLIARIMARHGAGA